MSRAYDIRGQYSVSGFQIMSAFSDYFEVRGFETLRHCPSCGERMRTNGNGDFSCLNCDYEDHQDIQPLIEAGLDYPTPAHARGMNRYFGYR